MAKLNVPHLIAIKSCFNVTCPHLAATDSNVQSCPFYHFNIFLLFLLVFDVFLSRGFHEIEKLTYGGHLEIMMSFPWHLRGNIESVTYPIIYDLLVNF